MAKPKPKKDRPVKTRNAAEIDPNDYNKVVKSADLIDLRMVGCNFELKPEYLIAVYDEDQSAKIVQSFTANIDQGDFDSSEGVLAGEVVWSALSKLGRKRLIRVKAHYMVFYSGLEGQDEACVREFFDRNAKLQTYPYFRGLVSRLTSEAGIELPLLPILQLNPNR